jgi:hypothetical protein
VSALPDAHPLLVPASYTPSPSGSLGLRGRTGTCCICQTEFQHYTAKGPVPAMGPCCRAVKESPAVKAMRRAAERRRRYTAAELVDRISRPGYAVVAFEGGVTLFVGGQHFQARTLAEAMSQAEEAGA